MPPSFGCPSPPCLPLLKDEPTWSRALVRLLSRLNTRRRCVAPRRSRCIRRGRRYPLHAPAANRPARMRRASRLAGRCTSRRNLPSGRTCKWAGGRVSILPGHSQVPPGGTHSALTPFAPPRLTSYIARPKPLPTTSSPLLPVSRRNPELESSSPYTIPGPVDQACPFRAPVQLAVAAGSLPPGTVIIDSHRRLASISAPARLPYRSPPLPALVSSVRPPTFSAASDLDILIIREGTTVDPCLHPSSVGLVADTLRKLNLSPAAL